MITFTIPGEPQEIWKDIKGYEGYYKVSNYGRIMSLDRKIQQSNGVVITVKGKILSPAKDGKQYLFIRLNKDRTSVKNKVHRIVAENFIVNPKSKPQVNHIDGNKSNNQVSNLEWCTGKENVKHAIETKLFKTGENVKNAKLRHEDVLEIRKTYIKGDSVFGGKPLAKKYNVSDMTIRNIINKVKWGYAQ